MKTTESTIRSEGISQWFDKSTCIRSYEGTQECCSRRVISTMNRSTTIDRGWSRRSWRRTPRSPMRPAATGARSSTRGACSESRSARWCPFLACSMLGWVGWGWLFAPQVLIRCVKAGGRGAQDCSEGGRRRLVQHLSEAVICQVPAAGRPCLRLQRLRGRGGEAGPRVREAPARRGFLQDVLCLLPEPLLSEPPAFFSLGLPREVNSEASFRVYYFFRKFRPIVLRWQLHFRRRRRRRRIVCRLWSDQVDYSSRRLAADSMTGFISLSVLLCSWWSRFGQ